MKFIPLSYKKFHKLPGVYIIRNIVNGKQYVGESINIWHRMYIHKTKNRTQIISKAIQKYGIKNFEVYIEYLPSFKKEDLLIFEEYMIKFVNSLAPNGYNICPTGTNNPSTKGISRPPRSKVWCSNLSKALKGKKLSNQTRIKMSESKKGRSLSTETKNKISIAHKGKKISCESVKKSKENHPHRKEVIQYDMNGLFIAEHMSLYDAERAVNGNATNISNACKGKLKTSYGFQWKFKKNN